MLLRCGAAAFEFTGCEPKEKTDYRLTSRFSILGFDFSNSFIVLYLEISIYFPYNNCIKEIDNPDLLLVLVNR